MIEILVRKGKHAGYKHFLAFPPQCFQKDSFLSDVKTRDSLQKGKDWKKPYKLEFFVNPFPNIKFKTSKLKEFADDNFKLDRNGRGFSKHVENTVEKGEIARSAQFLFFPQCFKKTCTSDM